LFKQTSSILDYITIKSFNLFYSLTNSGFFILIVSLLFYGGPPLREINLVFSNNSFNYSRSVSSRMYSTQSPEIPVKIYINADVLKAQILLENQGKTGVYIWENKLNGQRYVGSSVDLSKRFRNYFSVFFLEREIKKGNSAINQALLKYGYSNFSLGILEYCSVPEKVIEREQFYLDLLYPEYNILQIAGSSLGYKHSEETIAKLKARKLSEEAKNKISERMKGNTYGAVLKGRKRSEEVIAKHSERMKGNTYGTALKGIKRSEETIAKHSERMKGNTYATALKGIKRSEETIAKLKGRIRSTGAGTPSVPLEVLDLQTGEKTVYVSMSAFANFLGIPAARIASYFSSKTKKPYKGRYEMRKISS